MKNLITPEQVSRRATSPEGALEVSDEVWGQRCEMNEEELKEVKVSYPMCGLCVYYGINKMGGSCDKHGHGLCVLWEGAKGHCCCQECREADNLLSKFKKGDATYSEVKSAIYAMKARLEREKAKLPKGNVDFFKKQAKPEIRHGDYGFTGTGRPRLYLREETCGKKGAEYYANSISKGGTGIFSKECSTTADGIALFVGNLFDELSGMDGEMREYKNDKCGTTCRAELYKDGVYIFAGGPTLTPFEARRFARAILVLCANAERSGK
jgi:hypothetical protein